MITSLKNRKVAQAVKLKKRAHRDTQARFLVEGAQSVGEALDPGSRTCVEQLFHTSDSHPLVDRAREAGAEVDRVTQEVMARLTSTVTPPGLVGIAPFVDVGMSALPDSARCVAILHAVRDPGNAGTVLRSADGSGADAVVFSSSSVDPYNPKAVRASAGSLFHVPVVRGIETPAAIQDLRGRGFLIYATASDAESDLYELDLTVPVAFVFGNEAWGLPEDVATSADAVVRVPLHGRAESLNLAAAATVCLFEWAHQQREKRRVALETLITAAAHDIRSPLTALKGFGYALAGRWASMTEEHRSLMHQGIVYDTDRLNTIVKQLVDAARITAGRLDVYPERVDLAELVAELSGSLRRDPEHPEIAWSGGDVVAVVDRERLKMAIGAFAEAEVWWAREGPIHVTGLLRDGRLMVEVFRGGSVISSADAEELFQPRSPGAGSGSKIGLFVARGVAESQGGTATAEVDEVLRFRLDIPAGVGAAQPG